MPLIVTADRAVASVIATGSDDWEVTSTPAGFRGITSADFADNDKIAGFVLWENGVDYEVYDSLDDDDSALLEITNISGTVQISRPATPFKSSNGGSRVAAGSGTHTLVVGMGSGTAARLLRETNPTWKTLSSGDATPDVSGHRLIKTNGSTTITAFDAMEAGKVFIVQRGGADITIADGAGISLPGDADITLTASNPGAIFVEDGGVAVLVGRTGAAAVIDEDDFASDSAVRPPSQQSVGAYVKRAPNVAAATELTIATGAITPTIFSHTVDTESDAASDDLDTITATNFSAGDVLLLAAANAARTVVIKHGTGNILLPDDLDISLDDSEKTVIIRYDGSNWNYVSGPASVGSVKGVADKAALQALTLAGTSPFSGVLVRDTDYGGLFIRTTTDIQTEVTADTQAAVYVPFSGANGSTGGFIRVLHNNSIKAKWYGAVGDNSTDDTTALQAAIDSGFVIDLGVNGDVYKTTSALTVPANTRFLPSRARIHADHTGIALDLQGSNIKLNGLRVYSTKSDISVTNVTAANPAVITLGAGHGLSNGDRIKFPEMTSGMVELSGRSFEIAGLSGNTANIQNFTLGSGLANLDTSSYTAWSGSVTTTKYEDGHRGIFGQITTFSGGITPIYFDDIEVDSCEIEGFGGEGVRIDFTNRLKARSNKISRCGTHGGLFLSPIDFDISDNVISDVGPGVTASNAGYGISVSRVSTYNDGVGTVEATLAESPRPTNGTIIKNVVKGLRDYCGIDLHSCDSVVVTENNTDKCCMGLNIEHASSATVLAPCEELTVANNQFVGNDGGEYSVGPGIAVDAQSGAGEIVEGCGINSNLIKHHGKSGSHPLFTDSAAIYCVESDGVIIADNRFRENYSRDFLAKSNATNFSFSGNVSRGLNAVSSVQTMIVCKEAGTSGRIAGNTYINSAGEMFEVDGAPARIVNICENETITDGREITFESDNVVRGGAEMMTTTSRGYLQFGSYVTGNDFQLIYNGTQGVTARSISTITLSGSSVVSITTTANHNLSTGDRVFLQNIVGTTELNDKGWVITVTGATTFTLDNTDSSNFTAYTSGGTVYKLLEPYSIVQRNPEKRLKYVQYNSTGIVNLRYDTSRFNDVLQAVYPIVADSANSRAFLFSSSNGLSQIETTDNADAATDFSTVIVSMDGI